MHTTAAIQRGVVARAPTQPRTARRVVCASNVHKTLSHAVTTNPAAILATTLLSAAPAMADDLPIDASAALDAASSLAVSADPVLIAGAGAIVILGGGTFALTRSLSASKVRGTTPEKALDALSQEARVVLVDIRSKQAIKEDGSPDLKIVKRKPVAVPYTEVVGEEIQPVEGFVEKLLANPSIKEDSILILIDSYGQDAPKAAKQILTSVNTDTVYYITGGAEGPGGWRASEAPWKKPAPALSLPSLPNFASLGTTLDDFAEDFKTNPTLLKGALAVGAVVGAGALLLSQVEVLLELVGVVAAGRFLTTRLLFAQDREQTINEVKELVEEKIRVGEAGEDLKKLASTVLDIQVAEDAAAAAAAPSTSSAPTDGAGAVEDDSIEGRKTAVQAWISAWRARTQVAVREVVNA